jgi:hypothetical protein
MAVTAATDNDQPGPSTRRSAILLTLLAVVLMSPGLYGGSIITHSSAFNTVWAHGFAEALATGHPYPRWLPGVNDGMGSAVFYFYAPLPFYLTAPLVWATGDAGLAVVLGATLMLALSGLAAFALLRTFAPPTPSLWLSAAYMAMPYHFWTDIWVRGAYGEQAAFVFLPLAILCLRRSGADPRYTAALALAVAGQTLSHLPSTMFFALILVFLSLWTAVRTRSWRMLARAASAGGLGLAASAIYVLPALAGRAFIKAELWGIYAPAASPIGPVHSALDLLLLVNLLVPLAVLVYAGRRLWKAGARADVLPWLVIGMAIAVSVSPLASPVWRHAGPFQMIQFPWRMLSALDLTCCVVAALAVGRRLPSMRVAGTTLVAGFLVTAATTIALRHAPTPDAPAKLRVSERREHELLALKADGLEYLPSCTPILERYLRRPLSTGSLLESYRTTPTPPDALRVFAYPFLEVSSAGKVLATSCDRSTGFLHAENLPSDRRTVTVVARPLDIERWGWTTTFVGLLGIGAAWVHGCVRRARAAPQT